MLQEAILLVMPFKRREMYRAKTEEIERVIKNYFDGLFYGDTSMLKQAFHEDAIVYGDIKGETYIKPIGPFVDWVAQRESPNDKKEDFRMQILAIEVLGDMAVVKAHVPMLGLNYYDTLSLHFSEGNWTIVNKLFTHVE